MRPAVALAAVVMICGAAFVMKTGGQALVQQATVTARDVSEDIGSLSSTESRTLPPAVTRSEPPVSLAPGPSSAGSARSVAPDDIVPPPLGDAGLERAEPREPLSQLSLALPPKPRVEEDGGTILFRPVATGSARFEAMGRSVAVAGTENVVPDERCTYEGTEWGCGIRARTAFRYFIRGRALNCTLPPDAEKDVVADCRIGSQDVGAWLVTNGWARAAPGGPYAEAEKQAREARRGIFGPPPAAVE
jgi:endonuclease YncB( thermonuclease family)